MAPDPVPMSAMRSLLSLAKSFPMISSAAATMVSVSGRGTSVASDRRGRGPRIPYGPECGRQAHDQAALCKGGDDAGLFLSHLAGRLDRKACDRGRAPRRSEGAHRFRRIDIAGFEFCRQCAPRRLNGQSGERALALTMRRPVPRAAWPDARWSRHRPTRRVRRLR